MPKSDKSIQHRRVRDKVYMALKDKNLPNEIKDMIAADIPALTIDPNAPEGPVPREEKYSVMHYTDPAATMDAENDALLNSPFRHHERQKYRDFSKIHRENWYQSISQAIPQDMTRRRTALYEKIFNLPYPAASAMAQAMPTKPKIKNVASSRRYWRQKDFNKFSDLDPAVRPRPY